MLMWQCSIIGISIAVLMVTAVVVYIYCRCTCITYHTYNYQPCYSLILATAYLCMISLALAYLILLRYHYEMLTRVGIEVMCYGIYTCNTLYVLYLHQLPIVHLVEHH
jgi:hypothetical protein